MLYAQDLKANYTKISNAVTRTKGLSLAAKGLYSVLRGFSKDWHFNVNHLAEMCEISKNTFYKYFNELQEAGIIKRIRARNKDGKFLNETIYVFLDGENLIDIENLESNFIVNIESKNIDSKLESSDEIFIVGKDLKSVESPATSDLSISQNNQIPKFETLNNIKDSNKKKEVIVAPKNLEFKKSYITDKNAFINFQNILRQCNDYLQEKRQKIQSEKQTKEAEFNAFLEKLEWQEQEAYNDFIAYRNEKKKLKPTTIKAIQAKFLRLKESGENLSECVKISIERGWSGLFAKKETQGQFKSFKGKAKAKKPRNSESNEAFSFLNVSDAEMKAYAEKHGIFL